MPLAMTSRIWSAFHTHHHIRCRSRRYSATSPLHNSAIRVIVSRASVRAAVLDPTTHFFHIHGRGPTVSGMYHAHVHHMLRGYQEKYVVSIDSVSHTPGQTETTINAA